MPLNDRFAKPHFTNDAEDYSHHGYGTAAGGNSNWLRSASYSSNPYENFVNHGLYCDASVGYGSGHGGGVGSYPGMKMENSSDAAIQEVIGEVHNEQQLIEQGGEWGEQFKNAKRLLAAEVDKLENIIDPEWLEVDVAKPIKVSKKVLIPNFRHPHFNFVGKILGQKGATLQAMAKQFKCHIYVLGRGSTKDRAKEQDLLNSGDPQYAHYGGPLHVKVETIAPAHIAYQRIAGVLESLSATLQPTRDESYDSVLPSQGSSSIMDKAREDENCETRGRGISRSSAMGYQGRNSNRRAFRGRDTGPAAREAGGNARRNDSDIERFRPY